MRWITIRCLSSRTSIKELYEMTGLNNIVGRMKAIKMRWFGHVKRSDLPVRSKIKGMIEGKRRRGRPQRRWITDIHEWCDTSWADINKIVIDGVIWKSICSYMTNNQ